MQTTMQDVLQDAGRACTAGAWAALSQANTNKIHKGAKESTRAVHPMDGPGAGGDARH